MARKIQEWLHRVDLADLVSNRGRGVTYFLGGSICLLFEENREVAHLESETGRPIEIPLTRTSCNYGGSRLWFLCPDCGKRRRVLFRAQDGYSCGECRGLVYQTQQEGRRRRMLRKAERISSRIGCDAGFSPQKKPKGMHWRTFERLREAAIDAYRESLPSFRVPAWMRRRVG